MASTAGPDLWARLAAGATVVGSFHVMNGLGSVEAAAGLGFDFLFLDNEHGLRDPSEIRLGIQVAASSGIGAVVRVSGNSRTEIGKTLDAGAIGVVIPRIESASELSVAVAATRWAPQGTRGYAGSDLWSAAAPPPGYDGSPSAEPGVIAIVESVRGVEALEEIVAVQGLSAVIPGAGDLARELGATGPRDPAVVALIERIASAVARQPSGPALILPVGAAHEADLSRARALGATGFLVGPDFSLLRGTLSQAISRCLSPSSVDVTAVDPSQSDEDRHADPQCHRG